MSLLTVQIKRGSGGPAVLVCIRADGTRTWSQLHPFFPAHDLLHFAVETTLGFTGAFFGLIALGWSIPDFAVRGAARRLGPEAVWAEMIVGLFDQERATGNRWTAEEFNEGMRLKSAADVGPPFRPITEPELERIRALHAELVGRWMATEPGAALELTFAPEAAPARG
jgi:hypothetical protein